MEEAYNNVIWVTAIIVLIWAGIGGYLIYLRGLVKKIQNEDQHET
jgi:hypothetical protein